MTEKQKLREKVLTVLLCRCRVTCTANNSREARLGLQNDALGMYSNAVNMTGKANGIKTNIPKSVENSHVQIERVHREGIQCDRTLTLP